MIYGNQKLSIKALTCKRSYISWSN